MRSLVAFLIALATAGAVAPSAWGDVIHLKNGGTLEGVVLKSNEDGMVVLLKYASVTILSSEVESIEKSAPPIGAKSHRIADWQACFQALVGRPWGADLHPLPAPIVESGDLKNVPYVIHAAQNYEFVLYGDPEAPARVEIGVSGARLEHEPTRKECIDLVASFLRETEDGDVLHALASKGDKKERSGLVFEIDQEPDSRGKDTWWVSVTDPRQLDLARVSDREAALLINTEAPQTPRNPTLVEKSRGKGEPQEVITPFGTEPEGPHKKQKRTYGGGGTWGRQIHWNHGHVTTTGMAR